MTVEEGDDIRLVRHVLQAQEYWRLKGLVADVVIVNEHPADYLDQVQESLTALIAGGSWGAWRDRPGGVFLRRADALSPADRASLVVGGARGAGGGSRRTLRTARSPVAFACAAAPLVPATVAAVRGGWPSVLDDAPPLLMANGLGGFSEDGREYVVTLRHDQDTPAPWSNILANPEFGTLITSSGAAFTWAVNSREHRLTPFDNDPIAEGTSEAIYLRDDETGETWGATPSPMPRRPDDVWQVRHGAGDDVVRTRHPTTAPAPRGVRVPRRAGEGIAAHAHQHVGDAAAPEPVRRTTRGCSARRARACSDPWSPAATRPLAPSSPATPG